MNKHIEKILKKLDNNLSLLDNVLLYIKENSKEVDIYEIADIIKEDKTFLNLLHSECKNNKLLKVEAKLTFKLTDLFKDL